jgi:ABC-type glycerol-3-phosphate transport system substrate-binding protein
MDWQQLEMRPHKVSRKGAKAQREKEMAAQLREASVHVPSFPFLSSFAPLRLCVSLMLLFSGCTTKDSTNSESSKRLAGVKVKLVVVDDPAIAAAVRGLKDEWKAQTGAELDVAECKEKELADAASLPGDAVICPAYLLGPLAEAKRLAPVPHVISRNPDSHGTWLQYFPLLRNQEATWGNEVYGVPLGSPVFCCYCRGDLLEKLGRRPPQTWPEYAELARLLRDAGAKSGVKYGAVEPLGRRWAGFVLLARAAAYAKQRDNFTTLFDGKTFEPAIDEPPFVRALTELVEAAKLGPAEQLEFDPAAVRAEFWKGTTAMAISWPSANVAGTLRVPLADGTRSVPATLAELPGAAEVYRASSNTWEPRSGDAGRRVPLLGISGRMGVVRAESEHADAAFQLLLWLSDPQWSAQVFAGSPATTLFRNDQIAAAKNWVESGVSTSATRQYAQQTAATLSRGQFLASLRVPGRAEYLAALDEAVQAAVRGQQSPSDALKRAAEKWRAISKRLGVEKQKAAYLRSLGLE